MNELDKEIARLNESFEVPEKHQKQARIIYWGTLAVDFLVNKWTYKSTDLYETSRRALKSFSRKLVNTDGDELTSLSPELAGSWGKLNERGGIITLNHPTGVFLDPTAVLSLVPLILREKIKIITSPYQFPMNQDFFDPNNEGQFIPARATKDYVEQLHLLKEHIEKGGIILLIPKGTGKEFQGTFRHMLKNWNLETPILDFTLTHEHPFGGYWSLPKDYFQWKKEKKITVEHRLTDIGSELQKEANGDIMKKRRMQREREYKDALWLYATGQSRTKPTKQNI